MSRRRQRDGGEGSRPRALGDRAAGGDVHDARSPSTSTSRAPPPPPLHPGPSAPAPLSFASRRRPRRLPSIRTQACRSPVATSSPWARSIPCLAVLLCSRVHRFLSSEDVGGSTTARLAPPLSRPCIRC